MIRKSVLVYLFAAVVLPLSAFGQKNGAKVAAPVVSAQAGVAGGLHYIDLTITGGNGTGAPAGVSVQWMSQADYALNGGWFFSDNPSLCKGSFSGNAYASRYTLEAGQSVTVRIGDILNDNGASSNCAQTGMKCGTVYVFRAFAHANNKMNRSDFTANLEAATLPCAESCNRHGYGYWKTHPEAWPADFSTNLGNRTYSFAELMSIMLADPAAYKSDNKANGLVQLAHMLITSRLNGVSDADTVEADNIIGSLTVPPVLNAANGFDWVAPNKVMGVAGRLNGNSGCGTD